MARKVEDEGGIFERQGCGNVIYGKAIWENKKMNNIKHALYLKIIKAADALMLTVPFLLCWFFYYADRLASPFYFWGNWLVAALFLFVYAVFGKVYDAFLVSLNRISEMVYSQALAAVFSDFILYVVTCLLMKRLPNPLPLFGAFCGQLILAAIWCIFAHKWYFAVFAPKKSAIIYDTRQGLEKLIGEYGLEKKFAVCFTASVDECLNNMGALLGIETVFLSGVHSHDRNIIMKYCVENNIGVYVIPRIGDVIMSGAKQMHMFHLPMLRVSRYSPSPFYLFVKRAFDIVVSGIALIVLSPVFFITAAAVKATDGGPVFYKQQRLTKDGKTFYIHKFRSMRVDAEKDGVARLSTGDHDDRVTPVGKVIRRLRIDELPQLLDTISGNLSIVGPRPERPEIAALYEEAMPEFRLRLQAKAGLTGYAQVYGKYNTTPYDKLQMDLMYIAHPSILEDLRICLATVKILFMPESTEGVGEGQTTAMRCENEAYSTENDAETVAK